VDRLVDREARLASRVDRHRSCIGDRSRRHLAADEEIEPDFAGMRIEEHGRRLLDRLRAVDVAAKHVVVERAGGDRRLGEEFFDEPLVDGDPHVGRQVVVVDGAVDGLRGRQPRGRDESRRLPHGSGIGGIPRRFEALDRLEQDRDLSGRTGGSDARADVGSRSGARRRGDLGTARRGGSPHGHAPGDRKRRSAGS